MCVVKKRLNFFFKKSELPKLICWLKSNLRIFSAVSKVHAGYVHVTPFVEHL